MARTLGFLRTVHGIQVAVPFRPGTPGGCVAPVAVLCTSWTKAKLNQQTWYDGIQEYIKIYIYMYIYVYTHMTFI